MKRTHLAVAGAAALAVAALALTLIALRPKPIRIVTEGLDEASYRGAQALVDAAIRRHPEIAIELAPRAEKPVGLTKILESRPSLVFFRASAESDAAAAAFTAPDRERLGAFSRSFLWPVISRGKPYAYPVFFDHYEYDRLTERTAQEYKGTLESFGATIASDASMGKTFLACGKDAHLGALVSTLIASAGGVSSYNAVVTAMLSLPMGTSPDDALKAFLSHPIDGERSYATVRDAMLLPVEWAASGAVNQGWLHEGERELASAVKRGECAGFATFLSHHRTLNAGALDLFKTVPMPVSPNAKDAGTVNPAIALGVVGDPAKDKRLAATLDAMLDPETVYEACRVSGLAPGLSAARSPDVQASDVRSWIMGSERTIRGFDADAFRTIQEASGFFAVLRVWLMAETDKIAK